MPIGTFTFSYCTALESIYIPASVNNISETAFQNVGDNLTFITVAPDNYNYYSDGKTLYYYKNVFRGAADGSIPADATKIYACAFYGREKLTEIVIPKNIIEIGSMAFAECPNVTSITYEGTLAEWKEVSLGAQWFTGAKIEVVHCSDGDAELKLGIFPTFIEKHPNLVGDGVLDVPGKQ